MTKRTRIALGLGLAATVAAVSLASLHSPATADGLYQAFRRWGQTFVVTAVSDAALDVDTRLP